MAAVPSIGRASLVEPRADAPEAVATHGLYERHAAKIHSYCMHQLGSREEAEDAVQTTFMNAFRALGKGIVPEAEAAWLFKIAENVCLSRRRSSWRRNRIESPADFEVIEEIVPGPNRQRDELIGIEDALASMPEQQRRAILLREWQGLSYREISAELELSQSAVETLIFRARRSLAQGLTEPERVKPRTHAQRRRLLRTLHLGDLPALFGAVKSLLAGTAALKATTAAVVVTAAAGTVVTVSDSDAEPPRKPALAVSALPPLPPAVPVALASSASPASAPGLVERTPVAPRPAKPVSGIGKKQSIEKKSIGKKQRDARPALVPKAARLERKADRVEARTERKAARIEQQAGQETARAERRAELKAARVARRAERQATIVQRKADRSELRAQRQADKAERLSERRAEQAEQQAEPAQPGAERAGKPDRKSK